MKIKSVLLITLILAFSSLTFGQAKPRQPSGTFVASRVVHKVKVDNRNGMMIYVNFNIKNALDHPHRMIAYFYNATDGKPLASGTDEEYRTTTNVVSAMAPFTPGHADAVYKDLEIFIPYAALNLEPERGDVFDLKYYLAMYNNDDKVVTAKSGWYKFSVQY